MPRTVLAACRLQYAESRRQPAHLLALATTPLFTAMFLSITLHAGSRQAVVYAVIAPGLINLWFLSLDLGGEIVSRERWQGTLELLFATPASLAAVVFGRVLAVAGLAGLTFVEALLVARLGFGVSLQIYHGGLLAGTVVVTLFAMAGTATALAGLLVLSREVLLFQNSLTYPFYILGGCWCRSACCPAGSSRSVVWCSCPGHRISSGTRCSHRPCPGGRGGWRWSPSSAWPRWLAVR
jgi:ABC-2 type transport system permease protein